MCNPNCFLKSGNGMSPEGRSFPTHVTFYSDWYETMPVRRPPDLHQARHEARTVLPRDGCHHTYTCSCVDEFKQPSAVKKLNSDKDK